ncbi:Nodule Cysteine-Rich (NCR) secreted peptide [Medicago truncatula]|uniref:Nodule Cysteine-Rich (NCR) secreted peptide n=1 Tax=Medicago truncatula TaxID=3880 RepID=A0A072VKW9_MEDTR|nr:Nodule Cysteine-Rich (NCR) secreted peptide [Medicago truncatula]
MAHILKFVYATILVLFLFFVATKVDGAVHKECKTDVDCRQIWFVTKCINHECQPIL